MKAKSGIKLLIAVLALVVPVFFIPTAPVSAADNCGSATTVYGNGITGKTNSVGIKYVSGDGDHLTLKATDGSTATIALTGMTASGAWGDQNATSAFISEIGFTDAHTLKIRGSTTINGFTNSTTRYLAFTGTGTFTVGTMLADNINKISAVLGINGGTGFVFGGFTQNGGSFSESSSFLTCPIVPVAVTFTAQTASVPANAVAITTTAGTPITFNWSATAVGGTGCYGFESAQDNWYGPKAASGSLVVIASATRTYTLNCFGGPGGSTYNSIIVTVNPATPVYTSANCGTRGVVYGDGFTGKPNTFRIISVSGDNDHLTLSGNDHSVAYISLVGITASGSWGNLSASTGGITSIRFIDNATLEITGTVTVNGVITPMTRNITFAGIGRFETIGSLSAANINKISTFFSPDGTKLLVFGGYAADGITFGGTSYSLICSPVPAVSFTAQTSTVAATTTSFTTTPGTPITFNWSAVEVGATGCFGFESAQDNWYGPKAVSGSLVVYAPPSTRTYTLDCWGGTGGEVYKSITINI